MIDYKVGDIFVEDAEALVNSVNCVGVMGRGIALQFKNTYPDNFKAYAEACKRQEVLPGRMFVFETNELGNPRYIINFPTKQHWRAKSRMEDIETGLEALVSEIRARSIRSVAIPPLGSKLGGLNWGDVRPKIYAALAKLADVRVIVFTPASGPSDGRSHRALGAIRMTPGRAALIDLMRRYLDGLLDPFVTLLEVHKLMYFLQEAGEPLRLNFQKGHYGPYAEKLRHVLRTVKGHYILGYEDGGDQPGKELELISGAVEAANIFLEDHPDTKQRIERVFDLVEGFESSFGLELLSTVHWIAAEHPGASKSEIVGRTYAWNLRKRQFSERQIELAMQRLAEGGWLQKKRAPAEPRTHETDLKATPLMDKISR